MFFVRTGDFGLLSGVLLAITGTRSLLYASKELIYNGRC